MTFSTQQISARKWGIYSGSRLLATVGSWQTCETILANLSSGRRDTPSPDTDRLYQVPASKNTEAEHKTEGENTHPSDQQIAAELNAKQLKVSELEVAVLAVQKQPLVSAGARSMC